MAFQKTTFFLLLFVFSCFSYSIPQGREQRKPDQAALEQLDDDKKFLQTHHQLVETGLPKNEEHLRSVFPRK